MKEETTTKMVSIPSSHNEITMDVLEKVIEIYSKDYTLPIQRNIDLLVALTTLTEEEVEELDLDTFKMLNREINDMDLLGYGETFIPELNIDGELFGSKVIDNDYKFNVKETLLLQELFSSKKSGYLSGICAVVYHPIIDGEIKKDYSPEAIKDRTTKFNKLTIDVVGPFLNKLTTFLLKKND
jgi:hypothetical protein